MASRTQELDQGDILEVRDMAEVIARAEQIVAAPRSSNRAVAHSTDIFDALVRHPIHPMVRMPTDDAIGPATPAPRVIISAYPVAQQPHYVPQFAPPPASSLVLTVPVATEDDAYYAPGGRVRSLADVTLDGYRPEPTMLVRARVRRRNFTALAVAVLLPVIAIGAIAFFGHQETATAATSTTTVATATLPARAPAKPAVPAATTTPAPGPTAKTITAAALPAAAPKSATSKPSRGGGAVPTFDVNSLPTAKAK